VSHDVLVSQKGCVWWNYTTHSYFRTTSAVKQLSVKQDHCATFVVNMFECPVCKLQFRHNRSLRKHIILTHRCSSAISDAGGGTGCLHKLSKGTAIGPPSLPAWCGTLLYVPKFMQEDRHSDNLRQSCTPPRREGLGPNADLKCGPSAKPGLTPQQTGDAHLRQPVRSIIDVRARRPPWNVRREGSDTTVIGDTRAPPTVAVGSVMCPPSDCDAAGTTTVTVSAICWHRACAMQGIHWTLN